jgi:hypothetical protein
LASRANKRASVGTVLDGYWSIFADLGLELPITAADAD